MPCFYSDGDCAAKVRYPSPPPPNCHHTRRARSHVKTRETEPEF